MDKAEFIEHVRLQNLNPDTTPAQREANSHRLHWLEMLTREKPGFVEPVFYDAIYEAVLSEGDVVTPSLLLNR